MPLTNAADEVVVPVSIWRHVEPAACEYCQGLVDAYQGMVMLVGSDEYYSLAGPYHPGCTWYEEFDFIPVSEYSAPPSLLASLGISAAIWEIAHSSIWPLPVWDMMIDREKNKELSPYGPLDYDYSEDAVDDVKSEVKELKKPKTPEGERDRLENRYGELNVAIAYREMGV